MRAFQCWKVFFSVFFQKQMVSGFRLSIWYILRWILLGLKTEFIFYSFSCRYLDFPTLWKRQVFTHCIFWCLCQRLVDCIHVGLQLVRVFFIKITLSYNLKFGTSFFSSLSPFRLALSVLWRSHMIFRIVFIFVKIPLVFSDLLNLLDCFQCYSYFNNFSYSLGCCIYRPMHFVNRQYFLLSNFIIFHSYCLAYLNWLPMLW